jgi:hypothetical protein
MTLSRKSKLEAEILREEFDWKSVLSGNSISEEALIPPINQAAIATENGSKQTINPPSKGSKNEIKAATKLQQTDNKLATKLQHNLQQTGNKVATNWQQYERRRQESDNRTSNTTDNKLATKLQQTGNKVATAERASFSALVGLQRSLVLFVCRECVQKRTKTTGPLSLEYISSSVGTSKRAVKVTLQRLEAKGVVEFINFKNGRGGWTDYQLPDDVFQEALRAESDNKAATNWQQSYNKVTAQPATELATSLSSSSSSLNIKETTTTGGDQEPLFDPGRVQLAPQWLALDLEPLAGIGFTQTHLVQIVSQAKLSPELVQDSIHHFAFDLRVKNLKN